MNTRRIAWSIVGLLSLSAAARAGAVLELVPSNPGPYFGGEALTVDLWLRSDLDRDVDVTGIALDFQDTDGAITLDPEFGFDPAFYTPLPGGFQYTILPMLPRPTVLFQPLILLPPEWFVQLPATGRLHVGSIGVQLPTVAGSYTVDALNADETNLYQGGALLFTGAGYWLARDGALRGESLEFHIVPEPVTIVLLTVGVLILSRRRYRMIGGSSCTPSDEPVRDFAGDPLTSPSVRMIPLSCILVTAVSASILYAQPLSVPSQRVPSMLDSGPLSSPVAGGAPIVVFSQSISVTGAPWVRLRFGQVQLSGSSQQGNASFLRITSVLDGAVQSLDSAALSVWGNTSAYFNGDAVLLELLAYPGTGDNRVALSEIVAGISGTAGTGPPSECLLDDRIQSSDPRAGRLFYAISGQHQTCTTFLFNARSNCLLSAGHCCAGFNFGTDQPILEFNVPLSATDGTLNHPGPQDQYVVDPASVIFEGNVVQTVPGSDWCYFGVANNTTSLLSPLQGQGGLSFQLAPQAPAGDGSTLRVTGYGRTVPPNDLYATQQTATGTYFERTGTAMSYGVFAERGNSGSALEQQSVGLVYGIVTHGACNSPTFANFRTVMKMRDSHLFLRKCAKMRKMRDSHLFLRAGWHCRAKD